jgi:hypothetical protein
MIFLAPKCYECKFKVLHKLRCDKYLDGIPANIIEGESCKFYKSGGIGEIPG